MILRRSLTAALSCVAALAACVAGDGAPSTLLAPDAPAFARQGEATDPTAALLFPLDDAALGLRSDHLPAYEKGDASEYAEGVCGVHAKIFATTDASNSGDVIMHTNNPRYSDRKCADYPRKLVIDYGDGSPPLASTVFVNVREIQNTGFSIPLNTTVKRALHVNESRCDGLVWTGRLADGTVTGADSVLVTRTSATTWTVETQAGEGNNEAYCRAEQRKYAVSVRFTIVSSRELP